jgi:predicted dehydrogenase
MFSHVLMGPSQRARRVVNGGGLGELRGIHADLHFAKGHAGNFRIQPRRESGEPKMFLVPDAKREMFNIAVYSLVLIRWLTGRKAFGSVRAVTGNYFFEGNRQRDFEDFGVLAVNLEGGLVATVSSGRAGWRSHPSGGQNRTKLIGSRGSAFIDGYAARGEIYGDRQNFWRLPAVNPEDPMGFWSSTDQRKSGAAEWFAPAASANVDQSAFLDCLERGSAAEVTLSDGVRVLEVLLAAYRSAATGELVTVDPVVSAG